jgi:hypothetical protein
MTPSTNSASVNTSAQADPIAIRRQASTDFRPPDHIGGRHQLAGQPG